MRYLLDTNIIIWHFDDSSKLPDKIVKILSNLESELFVASISFWEIAIKMNIGKLHLDIALEELLSVVKNTDITVLQIEDEYLQKLATLPYIHKDPFDRLIISTALTEGLTILSSDENIKKYDVPWLW